MSVGWTTIRLLCFSGLARLARQHSRLKSPRRGAASTVTSKTRVISTKFATSFCSTISFRTGSSFSMKSTRTRDLRSLARGHRRQAAGGSTDRPVLVPWFCIARTAGTDKRKSGWKGRLCRTVRHRCRELAEDRQPGTNADTLWLRGGYPDSLMASTTQAFSGGWTSSGPILSGTFRNSGFDFRQKRCGVSGQCLLTIRGGYSTRRHLPKGLESAGKAPGVIWTFLLICCSFDDWSLGTAMSANASSNRQKSTSVTAAFCMHCSRSPAGRRCLAIP